MGLYRFFQTFSRFFFKTIISFYRLKVIKWAFDTHLKKKSKRKSFLSTCPSDKHYIKFCCPQPKMSLSKKFRSKLETPKKGRAFNVFNHIISLVNDVLDLNLNIISCTILIVGMTNVLTGLVTKT